MNVDQFKAEYSSGLTDDRKVEGLRQLFIYLQSDIQEGFNDFEDLVLDILDLVSMAQENDYFGPDGLNV